MAHFDDIRVFDLDDEFVAELKDEFYRQNHPEKWEYEEYDGEENLDDEYQDYYDDSLYG